MIINKFDNLWLKDNKNKYYTIIFLLNKNLISLMVEQDTSNI
jgi:hypothetical protein